MDFEIFLVVLIPGGFVLNLVAFTSTWSPARELVKKEQTITLTPETVSIEKEKGNDSYSLSHCRCFHGFGFHDPVLRNYSIRTPALILSWPPFTEEDRISFGYDPDCKKTIISFFEDLNVPCDQTRKPNEIRTTNWWTLLGGVVGFLLAFSLSSLFSPFGIQFGDKFVLTAITAITGAFVARMTMKHHAGDFVFYSKTPRTFVLSCLGIGLLLLMKLNGRGQMRPLLADTSRLITYFCMLSALLAFVIWFFHNVRKEEENRIGNKMHG